MKLVAIDSDLMGGVASVSFPERHILSLGWMPLRDGEKGKQVDAQALYGTLKTARESGASHAVAEGVFVNMSRKGTPMAGVHNQMQNYGTIRACCHIVFGPDAYTRAWPSAWKKAMGLSNDKEASLRLATDLFPSHSRLFGFKKNAGLAEALLMAEWHWQKNCTHVHTGG